MNLKGWETWVLKMEKGVIESEYLFILHQKHSDNFHNHDVTESPLDVEVIIISHFAEGKTSPEKTRSTERVQLRPSLNPSLLT